MQRKIRCGVIWVYLLCLVISYHVIGSIYYYFFVTIDWVETVTLWQKIKNFYMGGFSEVICPSVLLSIFVMIIILLFMKDE
ncbi:MAG: hypothetical protein HGJ97_13050 [Desulfosporosinus sp.]|nr:hypothetical protein [Desulfosporosinus sp.]